MTANSRPIVRASKTGPDFVSRPRGHANLTLGDLGRRPGAV